MTQGTLRRVGRLRDGDVIHAEHPCPSHEGYRHVVDDVRDLGGGFVRVFVDVFNEDGSERTRYDLCWTDDRAVEVIA